jgi:hypothetical protein
LVKKLGSNWEIKNSGARFNGILGSKLVWSPLQWAPVERRWVHSTIVVGKTTTWLQNWHSERYKTKRAKKSPDRATTRWRQDNKRQQEQDEKFSGCFDQICSNWVIIWCSTYYKIVLYILLNNKFFPFVFPSQDCIASCPSPFSDDSLCTPWDGLYGCCMFLPFFVCVVFSWLVG